MKSVTNINEFSLLFPNKNGNNNSNQYKDIEKTYSDLELTKLISPNIYEYYSIDENVIKYRLDLFADIIRIKPLNEILCSVKEWLNNFTLFTKQNEDSENIETELHRLIELEYYTDTLDFLYNKLTPIASEFKSDALINLYQCISAEISSEEVIYLKKELSKISNEIKNIKSITIGVNLNAQLKPKESGLVSVNSSYYKSGDLLDKLLRLDFKDDGFLCIAPLSHLTKDFKSKEKFRIESTIDFALDNILKKSIAKYKILIRQKLCEIMNGYVFLLSELKFVSKVSSFLNNLTKKEMKICIPSINHDDCCNIINLYNPLLCKIKTKKEIITNSITFDNEKRIYVLTGPNNGGKSVFTVSVAIAQALFQIGIPVPATKAEMKIADCIMLHFISKREDVVEGRLEDECKRLSGILETVSENSFLFMDETLSSTGAEEATELALNYIKKLSVKKCNCIYATHLHNLATKLADIPLIDTLSAQMTDHRTFSIIRKAPDGLSYAKDIAKKYGIM